MSLFTLLLGNSQYTEEDILNWNGEHSDLYFRDVLSLSKEWLVGKDSFSIQSSGSTGTPKRIEISRDQIVASAEKSLSFFDLKPGNSVLCPLNIHVVGGKMMLFRSIIGGLKVYVIHPDRELKEMDPARTYDFIPITALQLSDVLMLHPEKIIALNRLKHLLIGGGSISHELIKEIQAKLNCTVWQSYGMTETVSHIGMRCLHPVEEDSYTVLKNILINTDERNCLKIKGDITNNEWIQTNDIVEIQNDKHFRFIGRADFVINSGGIKIQTEILEQQIQEICINNHMLATFFVCGIPDQLYGEKVMLVMETHALNVDEKNYVLNVLKKHLPKHHAPKDILCTSFIYTESGKINRQATIEMFKLNK